MMNLIDLGTKTLQPDLGPPTPHLRLMTYGLAASAVCAGGRGALEDAVCSSPAVDSSTGMLSFEFPIMTILAL